MPRPARSRRLPRACLILPALSGPQALELVNLLDRTIAAIWRAHGQAMAECLSDLRPRPRRARSPELQAAAGPAPAEAPDASVPASQASLPF